MVCRYDYISYQRCFYSIGDNDFKKQRAFVLLTPCLSDVVRQRARCRLEAARPLGGATCEAGLACQTTSGSTLQLLGQSRVFLGSMSRSGFLAVVVEGLARRKGYVCTTNKLFVPRWFISAPLVIVIPTTTALTSIIPIYYLRQFKTLF